MSSHFRLKGLPPEDAAWVCGCGLCQPDRQQYPHGGWVAARQTSWGCWGSCNRDKTCCSVTWEGDKYWWSLYAYPIGGLCLWPRRGGGQVCVFSSDICLNILQVKYDDPSSSLFLYFSPPVSLYSSSVSAGFLASTGSLSCARSQPSLLFRSRIIRPLWGGSWCIFGLVSLDTSPTERYFSLTLLCFLSHIPTLCYQHLFLLGTSSFFLSCFSLAMWSSQIFGPLSRLST